MPMICRHFGGASLQPLQRKTSTPRSVKLFYLDGAGAQIVNMYAERVLPMLVRRTPGTIGFKAAGHTNCPVTAT
jgi:hypothetical protein